MPDTSWICRGDLIDEGQRTAVYPYSKLRNVLSVEDARSAVLEETHSLETRFGRNIVDPFYTLVWTLNTCRDVFTSHTAFAKPGHKSPFEWARQYCGALVLMLSRNHEEWDRIAVAEAMVNELGRALAESPLLKKRNPIGWFVIIRPSNVNFAGGLLNRGGMDYRGFGCEILISGSASSERKACERWSAATAFVADTLYELQTRNGAQPAPPYDHFANRAAT